MPDSMPDAAVMYQPKTVTAPGKTLADLLEEHGMTRTALAQRMGQSVHEIEAGQCAIAPNTAQKLERVFGAPNSYWLNHEAHYQATMTRLETKNG